MMITVVEAHFAKQSPRLHKSVLAARKIESDPFGESSSQSLLLELRCFMIAAMLAAAADAFQRVPTSAWVTGGGAAFMAFLAGLAFSNGVLKQLMNMVCVAVGVGVAWYCFRHRGDVYGSAAASMGTDRLVGFSAIAGLIAYGVARIGVGMLSAFGLLRMMGGLAGWKGVALSIIPSGFLLWVAAMSLRLVGNLYGMEGVASVSREGARIQSTFGDLVNQARKMMEGSMVGGLVSSLDPFSMRPTANLARLLIVWPDKKLWPALAANPKTGKIYAHPKVAELGYNQAVRTAIEKKDFAGLMQMKEVETVAGYPDLNPLLSDVALEDAMDQIIYGRTPNPAPTAKPATAPKPAKK